MDGSARRSSNSSDNSLPRYQHHKTQEQTAAYHYCIQFLSTTLQRNNAQTINAHLTNATAPAAATAAAATPTMT
eukprot:1562018-Karenia_brevis.AAC.1